MASPSEALTAAFDHHRAGRLAEAAALYDRVLDADPGNAQALHLRGLAAVQSGDAAGGAERIGRAAALEPRNAVFRANLGAALRVAGREAEAEAALRAALALDPGQVDAASNLGALLHGQGRHAAAVACLERARTLAPDQASVLINLGVARKDRGELEAALDCLRRAVAVAPDNAEAHWNLAVALLTAGRFEEGWREFEWRFRRPGFPPDPVRGPRWTGGEAAGLTLLVHAEQGRGDTLQFARYVPLLAARGARVVLACQPELARLLSGLEGVDAVVPFGGSPPPTDAHCPIMSLPLALGTGGDLLADRVPYLTADPAEVAAWRARLPEARLRVGLVWSGSPANPVDARRSLRLAELAPLAAVPDVAFVGLQKGPAAAEAPPPGMAWTDASAGLGDFADTAALVSALDLVVTVDTAVAHLAGALGRPVWLLNRYDGCWRWMKDGAGSAWYPALRQFRQPEPGAWAPAVAAAAAALRRLAETA